MIYYLVGATFGAFLGFLYFLPRRFISYLQETYPEVIFTLPETPNLKRIALTIDDAPWNPDSTQQILDVLKQHQVRCTFFIISDYGKAHPDLVQQMVEDGHELANHGQSNTAALTMNVHDLENEIAHCHDHLNCYQLESKWYRPGCGLFNQRLIDLVKDQGYQVVLGSVYPHDPQVPIATINDYYLRAKIMPNDIVILHDRSWTPALLSSIIPQLLLEGYQFVTLSEGLN